MTVDTHPPLAASKVRKVVVQLVTGAITGGLAMATTLFLLDGNRELLEQPDRMVALATAMIFGLMALVVGIGLLAPRIGAKTLNVEDASEIVDQRSNLTGGAITFALVALLLAALALADTGGVDGVLPVRGATVLAGLSLLALIVIAFVYRNTGDELMRAVSREASSWALGFILLLFGGWAGLAHLGLAAAFTPLLFIAGCFALYLLAVFVAAGRRGMMKPR